MLQFLVRRLLQAVGVLAVMSLLVFVGVFAIGNPVDVMIDPAASEAERQAAIVALGLDQPMWRQYLTFVGNALQGDMGKSFVYNQSASELILSRLPATFELAVMAMLIAVAIGLPMGLWAGLKPGSWADRLLMTISIFMFSLPTFWVGLLLIMGFAVTLGWLPSGGRGETRELFGVPFAFLTWDGFQHLLLPAFNLALFKLALVLRMVRGGVREQMTSDYVAFARAKGVSETRIVFKHVLRNIMLPVITVMGLEFGNILAFAVVTESIYAWPGMGKLLINAITVLDRPVIVAYLMITVFIFIVINLIVDLTYTLLDPRVRTGGAK
ncbi:ABC transporter permease [Xinfangfangia sp. CPCC 101601]|uniref:ABC transporter permease n=1 Tax=Pseudogemmobacter lacusdianii TaxID=3069608 RepID=A0ABU0W1P4_9RHOB|nr:ABC transporter permease [Xinfangfangia sp. CPCC 101601]MDQ2067942.1 ABC transporter permease [Xinfangfangia sp. CPCC 101601]